MLKSQEVTLAQSKRRERMANIQKAENHVLSGRWLRWMAVPAVTEVWRPQSAHSRVGRSRFISDRKSVV